ncbi:MAG: hypothetical protein QOK37_4163 [Thermoanaerobaculia bacterium]|jgi:hypothetical protein|nr:hypothetical protein [Thermoanaerobaculia bacterium]
MSAYSKFRVATVVLLFVLTTSVASAAPRRDSGSDGFFGTISRIVHQIGRILLPLDEPTPPKP